MAFTIGHTITIQGVTGVVQEVKLPCTILVTEDGEKVIVPNKEIVGQILHNSAEHKVVEKVVGISYGCDPAEAIRAIAEAFKKLPKISQARPPQIGIQDFGESSKIGRAHV